MRLLNSRTREVRAHELTLAHKFEVRDGVFADITNLQLRGMLEGNKVLVSFEWGRGHETREFGWTDKVRVR